MESSPQPTISSSTLEVETLSPDTLPAAQGLTPKQKRMAWIANHARLIYSAYRKDEFADPNSFLGQLGAVLERYPDWVIVQVCKSTSCIQLRYKTPPPMAAVAEACDAELARRDRVDNHARHVVNFERVPRPMPDRANIFVPSMNKLYAVAIEGIKEFAGVHHRYDARPGVWISREVYDKIKFRRVGADSVERI